MTTLYRNLLNNPLDSQKYQYHRYLGSNQQPNLCQLIPLKPNQVRNQNQCHHRVVLDIVEDRVAMHNDSVMTFENFKFFESDEFKIIDMKQCLYKGIDKTNIRHEKILADYYDVSLSQIDVVSPDKHIFKIDDLNIVIYDEDELNIIKENIKDYVLNQTFNKSVKLDLGNSDLDLNVNIKDFMDEDKFKNKIDEILSPENVKSIISSILDCEKALLTNDDGNNFIAVLQ